MAHQPRSQGFYEARHKYFYDFYKPYIFFLFFPTTYYYSFASASEKATYAIEKEILFSVWYSEVILVNECVDWRKNGSIIALRDVRFSAQFSKAHARCTCLTFLPLSEPV